jgi:hypothetical protein
LSRGHRFFATLVNWAHRARLGERDLERVAPAFAIRWTATRQRSSINTEWRAWEWCSRIGSENARAEVSCLRLDL